MAVVGYTTTDELARVLKQNATTYATQLTEVLNAALGEIDSEIGLHDTDGVPLTETWQLALAAQVQIERAVEHWHARPVGFGIVGLESESPIRLARDSWDRHANKLQPLHQSWGLA